MAQSKWEKISRDLYEALMQMRHSRGIDINDFDIVLDAMERYEAATNHPSDTMMWRANWHKSVKPYWVVTCRLCRVGEVRLPNVEIARKWCVQHSCEDFSHLADEPEAAALEE